MVWFRVIGEHAVYREPPFPGCEPVDAVLLDGEEYYAWGISFETLTDFVGWVSAVLDISDLVILRRTPEHLLLEIRKAEHAGSGMAYR